MIANAWAATSTLLMLIVLWVLLAGQPAAEADYRLKADAEATQISVLQTMQPPRPTPVPCWMMGHC